VQDSPTLEEERAMTLKDLAQDTAAAATPTTTTGASQWLAGVGIAGGLLAVVASSCCVIPLALAALGAGAGILGGLAFLAEWRDPFLVLSLAAVAGSWVAWRRRQAPACASGPSCAAANRSRGTLTLLICATLVVTTAGSWGYIEPVLLKMVRGR